MIGTAENSPEQTYICSVSESVVKVKMSQNNIQDSLEGLLLLLLLNTCDRLNFSNLREGG